MYKFLKHQTFSYNKIKTRTINKRTMSSSSSSQQVSFQSNNYSVYIPTINKKYSADIIINIFWKFCVCVVDRIDFVPIMKQSKDPKKEPFEDANFWQAFIYVKPKTTWAFYVLDAIEKDGSYKFYPNQEPVHAHFSLPSKGLTHQPNPKEYWVMLKNKNPVPYAQTHLNLHQLVHNNSLLETKVSEMEAKTSEMEAKTSEMKLEIAALKSKMEDMVQDVARLQYDNDTMSMQLSEAAGRTRSDSHSTTESEAESFVKSFENILRMAEEQQGIYSDENGNYQEYIRQRMYEVDDDDNDGREREEDLVYDDSGEMTLRGRVIKKAVNTDNCHNYAMLDIDGYNNGDVAPRGWKVSIEDDGESSPRGNYEDDGESSPRGNYEYDGESSPRGNYEDDGDYHDEEVFVRCEVEDFSRNDDDDRAEHDLGNRFRIGTDVNWSGDE